jgi:hypothetical protein
LEVQGKESDNMIFNVMFYGGLVLFILFLVASVVLFFKLDVLKAIGVVTGQTQKKAIEEIRSGGRATTSKRGKGSFIKVRDLGTGSGLLKDTPLSFGRKKDTKRNSDASESLAEQAANDARLAAARAMAEKAREKEQEKEKEKESLESDATEVLTYNEAKKKKDQGEDTTSVLEEEQATAILSAEDEEAIASGAVNKASNNEVDEDETDVLRSSSASIQNEEEEATDILRNVSVSDSRDDLDDDDPEELATDVLTTDMGAKFKENEIYGTYNPEMTAVLRSDMVPGEDSVKSGPKNIEGITILYSETIVHTEESL